MKTKAFTLSELLIALAILGVIATFTIPKVLNSTQNSQYNALAKESASMLAEALTTYKLGHTVTATTGLGDLTPYLNYVKVDSTTQLDSSYDDANGATIDCTSRLCLKLHNGAVINFSTARAFGGTASTNGIVFGVDLDGKQTDASNIQNGRFVMFVLYSNGRITGRDTILPNTGDSVTNPYPAGILNPPWFTWN